MSNATKIKIDTATPEIPPVADPYLDHHARLAAIEEKLKGLSTREEVLNYQIECLKEIEHVQISFNERLASQLRWILYFVCSAFLLVALTFATLLLNFFKH